MRQELEPLVDPAALATYLADHLPGGLQKSLSIERHMAGHSNETFFISSGPDEWVLRRPPRGAFLPTAHDVLREYRVLSALADTPVRAPKPILSCADPTATGSPFYLMERIRGNVIRHSLPEPFASSGSSRPAIGEELVDALVELHAVDWRAAGLDGFGKPEGYLQRQLRRWTGQLALTEPLTRRVEELHQVAAWLQANVPETSGATVVHGDYKLDNVVFTADGPSPRLAAILDWEMSTIGDPLADLGWMLSFWREPADPVDFELEGLGPTREPGFASRAELLARYEDRSGRPVGDLSFYLALAVWKLAILLEGSYARHLTGVTDDPFFAAMEEGVPALARRALAVTRQLRA
jgi:aminoglycoside phosphotransferase (APT) family kinase protein